MKKKIALLSAGVLSLTLFSFTSLGDGVTRDKNGNYIVHSDKDISVIDKKNIVNLNEEIGVATKIVTYQCLFIGATCHASETIFVTKNHELIINEMGAREYNTKKAQVDKIMAKYLSKKP